MTTQGDQQTQNKHFVAGQEAFAAGDFAAAIVAFQAAIKADLNDWEARLYLGTSQFKSGDAASAAQTFRQVHQKCPLPELRIKAMKALDKIEQQLSGGEEASAISQVLIKPSVETLRNAYATLRRPAESHVAKLELSLDPQEIPLPEQVKPVKVPRKAPRPQPAVVTPPPAEVSTSRDEGMVKQRIPTPVAMAIVLAALVGVVYWAGSLLLPDLYTSMFVKPSARMGAGYSSAAPPGVQREEITFAGPGPVDMYGLLLRTGSKRVVLINRATTGNAGDDWTLADQIARSGMSVFVYDYRGFGQSKGKADVQGLLDDGLLAHDNLVAKWHYKYSDIIVYGKGVGAGVAVEIARRRSSPAVVLESGYGNLMDVAKKQNPLFALYGGDLLPRQQYDNKAWAKEHGPVLLMQGDDEMIPPAVTKQFYESVAEPKKIAPRDYDALVRFISENAGE